MPQYNPAVVYAPPPSYVYDPFAPLVTFGVGMAMGAIIANNCDWYHGGCYHGDVDIDINKNELATLQVVRAYVDAQREYASRDRDGDEVREYAQRLASSPGQKDGLFWPPDLDGEVSPLGPLVAQAQGEGYAMKAKAEDSAREPFHGYSFKILTRQGKHAAGGKHDYVINGNMIGGFALVAWPAQYGESGIMAFIVNQQGRVYQKDLGAKTGKLAPAMRFYDPDRSWSVSPN